MATKTPEPDDTQVLGRIFGPTMGRILEKYLQVPVFFLTPHPKTWTLQYYAEARSVPGQVTIEELIRTHHDPALGWGAEALDRLVENLSGTDPEALRQAAAQELRKTQLPLGWTDAEEASRRGLKSHWALARGGSSTLRFMQHALDHAHGDQYDALGPPSKDRKLEPYGRSQKLIKITNYMQEVGLIDQESFPSYLAESLYSQPTAKTEKYVPSKLDHFFLPLAGLGQWRAAACWVAYEEEQNPNSFDIGSGMQLSIQALFSQALIDAFISQLDQTLVAKDPGRRTALHDIFALLWWSHEIAFFRDGSLVALRVRDRKGVLQPSESRVTGLTPGGPGGFLALCPDPTCRLVRIDLTQLGEEKNLAREVFDCDRIVISTPLIDPAEREMVETVYGERLREQIALSLRLYHLQQDATRAQTVEAIGHSMKNTLHITGWQESLRQLQDLGPSPAPAVAAAIRSLSLYALVSGLGGLLRLVSLCERQQFEKIGKWTTPSALDAWFDEPHEAFDRYVFFVRNYVATICHGLGWHRGFELVVQSERREETLQIDTLEPPEGSIRAWIDRVGNLPPLSATEGPDAHTALLSALTEPVSNAVRSLLSMLHGPSARAGRLFVRIVADFPRGIDVEIGNETDRPPQTMPPGLVQHREMLARSFLASLQQLSPPQPSGALPSYRVEVKLHPLQLAEKILARSQGEAQ